MFLCNILNCVIIKFHKILSLYIYNYIIDRIICENIRIFTLYYYCPVYKMLWNFINIVMSRTRILSIYGKFGIARMYTYIKYSNLYYVVIYVEQILFTFFYFYDVHENFKIHKIYILIETLYW